MLGLGLLLFLKLLSLAFILYSVAASFPKIFLSKQRKVDKECRVFQHSWSVSYSSCRKDTVASETRHAERYRGLQGQPRREKVKELIAGLKKQSVFTSSRVQVKYL